MLLLCSYIYICEAMAADNSTYPKAGVKWLNRALCFYLSSLFIDSFWFQNPRLRVAAPRYALFIQILPNNNVFQ